MQKKASDSQSRFYPIGQPLPLHSLIHALVSSISSAPFPLNLCGPSSAISYPPGEYRSSREGTAPPRIRFINAVGPHRAANVGLTYHGCAK